MPCTSGVVEIVWSLYVDVYGAPKKLSGLSEGEKLFISMDVTITMGASLDAEQQVEHVIDTGCIASGAPVVELDTRRFCLRTVGTCIIMFIVNSTCC
jgi:hypothetical protein